MSTIAFHPSGVAHPRQAEFTILEQLLAIPVRSARISPNWRARASMSR